MYVSLALNSLRACTMSGVYISVFYTSMYQEIKSTRE